jgi:hypothetical protein
MSFFRALRHACAAAALVSAAACADSTSAPVQPAPGPPGPASLRLACTASVAARTVECAPPGAAGLRKDRIFGNAGGMKLTSSNVAVVADSFMFDVTVTNQVEYPVGTTDGVNADPNGIRVFFIDGIHTTQGTGAVTVANADGVGTFTASGQAYFAYHGVLAPAATTAPRRWKLRFEPGVETFSFMLYVSAPAPPGGGRVWMRVLAPTRNAVVGDSVLVQVRVDSAPASIQSVTASTADRSVVLAPVSAGVVGGKLNLAGLPLGSLELLVHAVTVHADTGNVVVPLTKDSPPTLAVSAPGAGYVARPNLRIDVDCTDDDAAGCASVTARIGATTLASGTAGIHADVSLAVFNEQQPTIELRGVDSRGQTTLRTVAVYVQPGAALLFADSAGSVAMDLDSARLLFAGAAAGVWLRDRGAASRTLLGQGGSEPFGYLHAQGAIFGSNTVFAHVYDWRSGTLVDLGQANAASSLEVAGNWAIWSNGTTLTRRDLAAGTNLTVSTNAGSIENDVAANGDVVAWTRAYDVFRWRSGTVTPITADLDSAYWNTYPVTDGTNVLYRKSAQHGLTVVQPGRVAWWDGATETLLSDTTTVGRYAASGGWIAYPVVDGGGVLQVRTRAPDGTVRQATTSASPSIVRALGPDGTVVYSTSNGSLYVVRAPYTGLATRLGRDWLRPSFRGTTLLLFLGNTVFQGSD